MRAGLFLYVALCVCAFCPSSWAQEHSLDDELIYRINFGRADDVKILLGKGANPNTYSTQGDTALTTAITRSDAEAVAMVKILLDGGADPNLQDKHGNYPIMIAARNGQGDMVKMLMDKKADFHVKTADGVAVIDIARQNGTPGAIAPIQAALDAEAAEAASLRTPARLREIIRRYAFLSCSYQYWSYYLTSRQNPELDGKTQSRIADDKAELAKLLKQIQMFYPQTRMQDVQSVSEDAGQSIFNTLEDMVSNRNRAEKGIGSEEDAKRRCEHIAARANVDLAPPR